MSYFDDLDSDFNGGKVSKSLTDEQIRERASMVNGGETGYEQKTCAKCGGRGSKTYGYVNIRTYNTNVGPPYNVGEWGMAKAS